MIQNLSLTRFLSDQTQRGLHRIIVNCAFNEKFVVMLVFFSMIFLYSFLPVLF